MTLGRQGGTACASCSIGAARTLLAFPTSQPSTPGSGRSFRMVESPSKSLCKWAWRSQEESLMAPSGRKLRRFLQSARTEVPSRRSAGAGCLGGARRERAKRRRLGAWRGTKPRVLVLLLGGDELVQALA